MSEQLRFGVVGTGYLGRFHAQKYAAYQKQNKNMEFVGVFDLDPVRAKTVADEIGVESFSDWDLFLKSHDAVSVVTSTKSHFDIGLDLLKHGKSVLMEKPMTHNLATSQALCKEVENNPSLVFQVGHIERFNPAYNAFKLAVKPAKVHSVSLTRLTPFQQRGSDVDVAFDLMIHDIDLILDFWNKHEVVEIMASGQRGLYGNSDDFDFLQATLKFSHGGTAMLTAGRVTQAPQRLLRAMTSDDFWEVNLADRTLDRFYPSQDSNAPINTENFQLDKVDALALEVESFIQSVQTKSSPRVTAHQAMKNIDLAEQIIQRAQM